MKLSLLILLLVIGSTDGFAQVPWIETKFPGAAPISGKITQIEADQNGAIYGVVKKTSSTPAQIARSTDRGESWLFHDLGYIDITGFERFGDRFYQSRNTEVWFSDDLVAWYLTDQAIGPINANKGILIAQFGSYVAYMPSPGSDFVRLPDSVTFGGCAIAPQHKEFVYCLSKSGLWRSPMGSSNWTKLSDGYSDTLQLRDIAIVGDSLFIATEHAMNKLPLLFTSHLSSLRLTVMMIEGSFLFRELFTHHDSILVAVRYDYRAPINDIHYSRDLVQLVPALSRPSNTINDLAKQGDHIWFASDEGIWWNTDIFRTWDKASRRLEANVITHLQAIPPKTLLAVTTRGDLMISEDKGESWADRYSFNKAVTMIGHSPNGTLFVGQDGQLLASNDRGQSFIGTDGGFKDRRLNTFAVGKNGKLFIGTDSGLYYSTNDGQSWFRPKSFLMNIMTGINRLPAVNSIAWDHRDGLYVGTDAGVIFSLSEGERYESGWLRKTPVMALTVNKLGEAFAGSYSISAADPNRRNFYRGWDVLWQNPAWVGVDTTIEKYDMDKLMLNSRDQIISGMLFSNTSGHTWVVGEIEGKGSPEQFNAQAIDTDDIAFLAVNERLYRSAGPKLSRSPAVRSVSALGIYPNPASNELRIGSASGGDVSIYNALGEMVLNESIEPDANIDICRLPPAATSVSSLHIPGSNERHSS